MPGVSHNRRILGTYVGMWRLIELTRDRVTDHTWAILPTWNKWAHDHIREACRHRVAGNSQGSTPFLVGQTYMSGHRPSCSSSSRASHDTVGKFDDDHEEASKPPILASGIYFGLMT